MTTIAPERIKQPSIKPETEPERRYDPLPNHCPGQTKRTVRRVREV